MSLNLDARQRAMLQEMGHPLWWPQAPASAAPAPIAVAAPAAAADSPSAAQAQEPAENPLQSLKQHAAPAIESEASALPAEPAVAAQPPQHTQRTAAEPAQPLVQPRPLAPPVQTTPADFPRVRFALRAPVLLNLAAPKADAAAPLPVPATGASWLVVAELPEGAPPNGSAGQLVVNMLRAMRLTDAPVYWVPLERLAPDAAPDDDTGQSIEALAHELKPCMALLLGLPAARHLLPGTQPLAQLRQQVHTLGANAVPAIVSYDPAYLLRTPQAKAQTWADLCMALEHTGR